jgi:HEAT repeat protein
MSNKYANTYNSVDRRAASRSLISAALATICAITLLAVAGSVTAQQLSARNALNRLAQQSGNDAASVLFRGGRDLITDEQWAKAEEKFSEYLAGYPNDRNADAALYWKAYSEYQLAHFDKCRSTIDQLLKDYQKSSWKEDARTLLAQIPGAAGAGSGAGDGSGVGVGVGSGGVRAKGVGVSKPRYRIITPQTPVRVATTVAPGDVERFKFEMLAAQDAIDFEDFKDFKDFEGKYVGLWTPEAIGGGKAADDDPCEFKIVVLQALFQSDVQRGISAATEWLSAGSTQTVRCKGAALSLLARNGGKAVTPVILGIAKNEPDVKLRARAISALGTTSDDTVIDPLRDFALNSQDNSIAEAALYALGRHNGPRAVTVLGEIAMSSRPTTVRRVAIASIASRPGEPSVDALLKIYDADQTVEIRRSVIGGLGHRKSERAGSKLLEIARSNENIELRKAAISSIVTRSGSGDKAVDTLLGLYDSEKSEELKDRIINSIGSLNDPRVTKKLIEVARNPQSPMERRRRAIGWLSRSKDPEVTKFLEELLK